jgi:hypothetical protein
MYSSRGGWVRSSGEVVVMAMDAKEPSHLGCAYLSTKSLFLGGIYKRSQTPNKTIWYF